MVRTTRAMQSVHGQDVARDTRVGAPPRTCSSPGSGARAAAAVRGTLGRAGTHSGRCKRQRFCCPGRSWRGMRRAQPHIEHRQQHRLGSVEYRHGHGHMHACTQTCPVHCCRRARRLPGRLVTLLKKKERPRALQPGHGHSGGQGRSARACSRLQLGAGRAHPRGVVREKVLVRQRQGRGDHLLHKHARRRQRARAVARHRIDRAGASSTRALGAEPPCVCHGQPGKSRGARRSTSTAPKEMLGHVHAVHVASQCQAVDNTTVPG